MSKYPLCRAMGLVIRKSEGECAWVTASELENILSQAPVVTAYVGDDNPYPHCRSQWSISDPASVSTHTARLLCIEPIVRESEERRLLRELLALEQSVTWRMPDEVVKRIEKLLGGAE